MARIRHCARDLTQNCRCLYIEIMFTHRIRVYERSIDALYTSLLFRVWTFSAFRFVFLFFMYFISWYFRITRGNPQKDILCLCHCDVDNSVLPSTVVCCEYFFFIFFFFKFISAPIESDCILQLLLRVECLLFSRFSMFYTTTKCFAEQTLQLAKLRWF